MSNLKLQIAQLAAQQVPDSQIAAKLQITQGYVSQLKQDNEYQHIYNQIVAARRLEQLPTVIEIDTNYDRIEHTISSFVADNTEAILAKCLDNPAQLFRVMQQVNSLKRRGSGEAANGQTLEQMVVLELPTHLLDVSIPQATITAETNEVIAVGDKTLVPLSQQGLRSFAELHAAQKTKEATELSDFLATIELPPQT